MSTTLKIRYLKSLRQIGKRSLIAKSVFGFKYRISLGDMFSENPYYNPYSNVGELIACAAWVWERQKPVVFDIGAHCGFIATQLAQILSEKKATVFAFEPVPPTFSDLAVSVDTFGLNGSVHPIQIALSDESGFVSLSYSRWTSMFSQIVPDIQNSNNRGGRQLYLAPSNSLDNLIPSLPFPDVIKIDVEGWEVPVFRGAVKSLQSIDAKRTGICLEWNPEALHQAGFSSFELGELLKDYDFYYINDYEGQLRPELEHVPIVSELNQVCNLFAIKKGLNEADFWKSRFRELKAKFKVSIS